MDDKNVTVELQSVHNHRAQISGFFLENRPKLFRTHLHVMDFKDSHYFKYYDRIKLILTDHAYRSRIQSANRVECRLPEYNIVTYSKFHYLNMAMSQNPFNSSYVFWMDAGLSRFFMDVDVSQTYPSSSFGNFLARNPEKFIIQKHLQFDGNTINDDSVWTDDSVVASGIFGGGKNIVLKVGALVEWIWNEKMLARNNVNNEQKAIALAWKYHPEYFILTDNVYGGATSLFKLMAESYWDGRPDGRQ